MISVQNGAIAGKIYTKEVTYVLSPLGNGRAILSQLDDPEPLPCGVSPEDVVIVREGSDGVASSPPSVSPYAEDGSIIDVLVFYTAQAREIAGGRDNVESTILMAVSDANLAFQNSEVSTRFNPVGVQEIEYEETRSSESDLNWLTNDDTVAQIRNELAADLVGMVVSVIDGDGGRARIMGPNDVGTGFAPYAFQVSAWSGLNFQILAHEFGHSMGATHNVEVPGSGTPAFPYGHGHYVDGSFRTIMSYPNLVYCPHSCPVVPHFSNPAVEINGDPTGVAEEQDNHRVLNQTAVYVANFRVPLPRTPENVQASDGTYMDRVRTTWNSVDRAEFYALYRSASTTGPKTAIASSLALTSFDDTSAIAGTTYYYWVKASNSAGSSNLSPYNTGYRAAAPPAAPTGVSATDGAYTDRVRITWSTVSGTTYSVFRATSTSGAKTSIATSLTSTNFDDASVIGGTTYYYWVKASNSSGSSDFSSYNTGYSAVAPPAAPAGVSATDGTYTDRVRITWNAVSGATYSVFRATSTSGTKTTLATSLTATSLDDTSAVAGQTYYYWVKAMNSSSSSDFSSYNTGYRAVAPPEAPTGVSATDGTYTDRVWITWNAVSGATTYSVFRATSTSGAKTTIATSLTSASFDDTSGAAGTTYYYWVKALNSSGSSDFSSYNAGYRAAAPPAAPTGVSATDGSYTDRVRITWNTVSGATYFVYRATSTSGTKTTIENSLTSTSFDDTSAVAGTIYYYWVKASSSSGSSDFSSYNTGYRAVAPPVAPTGVSATDGTYTDRVRITWNAVSGASGYVVYRATSTSGTKTVLAYSLAFTSFDDTSAIAGTTYYYWVKASNSSGSSDLSSYNTGYRRR
ncbi:MAG: M12 family metallo-peptidase [Acidobacteriota bacterium]